jgi:hypothetical protein
MGALWGKLGGRAPLLRTLQARSYQYPETGSETEFGFILTAKTRLLSFSRTQSKVVIGLFIGRNTPRRHFYLMEFNSSPYIGGVEERKKPQSTFCVSAKLWLHSDIHIRASISWTSGC